MNLFSFLRSGRLEPDWKYTADGMVWRLLFTDSGRIVGESRNQEKKTASFFCLDEETGEPLWHDLKLEESWWIGIEGVLSGTVLLHTYASPDMPQHRGIRAFDVETGALLWRKDDIVFWFGKGESVFGYRDFFEKRVGYELDVKTGELKATHDQSLQDLHAIRRDAANPSAVSDLTVPEILTEEGTDASTLAFVKRMTKGKNVAGNIELILQKDILAFNYHLRSHSGAGERPTFDNHLCVYRLPKGTRLFAEVIAQDLAAYASDSFFIRKSRLFFVKDQQTLMALRLWK